MKRNELIKTFNWKIASELKLYKASMMQKEKDEIFADCYEIDYMIRIYESLKEKSQKMGPEALSQCIQVSGLLASFYQAWLKVSGSSDEDLEELLEHVIHCLERKSA